VSNNQAEEMIGEHERSKRRKVLGVTKPGAKTETAKLVSITAKDERRTQVAGPVCKEHHNVISRNARCESDLERSMRDMVANLEEGHHVAEVFSPPRVVKMPHELGLKGGWSLDITTCDEQGIPWDFS
jgi:hypothetical protein